MWRAGPAAPRAAACRGRAGGSSLPTRILDDKLHVLHLQRESADGPLEALEVGDEAGVAEIANVLVALFLISLCWIQAGSKSIFCCKFRI